MAIIKLRKGESEMKTKYIRDFRHNYLVIEKEDPYRYTRYYPSDQECIDYMINQVEQFV